MTDKYAVFQNGGKQYKVAAGQKLKLELMQAEAGDKIKLEPVLLVGEGTKVQLGEPSVKGASIEAEVIGHGRADKIEIIKFKRRKHHMKRMGHRQHYTEVKIVQINQ